MVNADSGGGGSTDIPAGAVSGQIEITIEAIRRIARDNMAAMQDNATSQSSDFRALDLAPSAFGQVPIAQTVGQQHQAAHQVFMDTIDGVIADLETFAANIEASCNAHEATDEQSAADAQRAGQGALSGLNESMSGYQSQADQNFDNAGAEHREELGDPPPAAEQREGSEPPAGSERPEGNDGATGNTDSPETYSYGAGDDSGSTESSTTTFEGDAAPTPIATSFDADGDGTIDVLEPALPSSGSGTQAQ
ncbi:hypothetical protein G7072_16410 [Nocardioides sp. HDW12B]|uniref:hypothetical protein n=1 Tax=Nocardioides sp. HDW12B TaxID=2714939 RepID=UPI00140D111F|nr:hypothetical protein [Nocardioides sp. HDW12B]QIK67718.1 hypothetical protein G7072_16410 [Nocardioides sp. HDW12B]